MCVLYSRVVFVAFFSWLSEVGVVGPLSRNDFNEEIKELVRLYSSHTGLGVHESRRRHIRRLAARKLIHTLQYPQLTANMMVFDHCVPLGILEVTS
jgi:hypothetical protein